MNEALSWFFFVFFFFLSEIGRLSLTFIWRCKGPRIAKNNLEKDKKMEDLYLPI
jgi:hypothetical protein